MLGKVCLSGVVIKHPSQYKKQNQARAILKFSKIVFTVLFG